MVPSQITVALDRQLSAVAIALELLVRVNEGTASSERSNEKIGKLVQDMLTISRDRKPEREPVNLGGRLKGPNLAYHLKKHAPAR